MKFRTLNRYKALFIMSLLSWKISAYAVVVLPGGGTGPFAKVQKFFQEIVDFLGGTGTLFVVFVALVAGISLWVAIPKQAGVALGWVFRAIVGGIFLFGIGIVLTWIKTF